MSTGDLIFSFTLAVGFVGCWLFVWLSFVSLKNDYRGGRVWLPPPMAVAYGGFSVFPIINFVLVVVTCIYLVAAKEQS